MLFKPVAALLGQKRLLIVPDGALHYVPFAALPVVGYRLPVTGKEVAGNRQPLIANHEIATANRRANESGKTLVPPCAVCKAGAYCCSTCQPN